MLEICNPIPLKKEFNLDEVIIVEIKKQIRANNKYIGSAVEMVFFSSERSSLVKTRYRDKPLIPIFNMSLMMLQSLFLSIKILPENFPFAFPKCFKLLYYGV